MSLSKRARRFRIFLVSFALILCIGAWWVNRQLEPVRLTHLVLGKIGEELQLKFEFEGVPSYAMKPEPRLILPNLEVTNPVDDKVFLSAKRVEISLPWSTILGDTPHITRIEADDPALDLPGLRKWQSTRPPTPFEIPTFTRGLEINNGQLFDEGYTIRKIQIALPHLENRKPLDAKISAVFQQEKNLIAFEGSLALAEAGLNSGFTLDGKGELTLDGNPLPYQIKTAGNFANHENGFDIQSQSLSWISTSPLPNLQASLTLSIGETLKLQSKGRISEWPKDWPALPAPINRHAKDLPYELAYTGKSDFSDAIVLKLEIENSRLDSTLRIAEIRQWLDSSEGSPLPPLTGKFETPAIQLEGAKLEGISIEISPDAVE